MGQTKIRSLQTTMPNADGWMLVLDTWTYASVTTITVPSGAALLYAVGDKIRLKQGAGYKYFYVIVVADTLLTVTGGSDYTVATPTAITDVYYSHATSPVGFPNIFSFTPVITAGSGTFTTVVGSITFSIVGKLVGMTISISITTNGTAATFVSSTLPFNASQSYLWPSRETQLTGSLGQVVVQNDANFFTINNAYPGGDNYTLIASGIYII